MTPSVEILIGISLICLSPFLLVVWTQRRNLLSGKKEDTEMPEADYQQAQAVLIECRTELHESAAKERSLRARIEKATAQIERAEKRLEKAPKDAAARARLSERITTHQRAERDLKQQIAETKRLRDQKFELESEVQRLYSLKEFAKSRSHYVKASKKAGEKLATLDELGSQARIVIDKAEANVIRRELEFGKMAAEVDALRSYAGTVMDEAEVKIARREADSLIRPAPNPFDDVAIEQAERLFATVASLGKTFDSIRVLAEIADPSVERAYQRLCAQLENARQQADRSLREEEHLDEQVARFQNAAETWQVRSNKFSSMGETRTSGIMAQRKGHSEAAAAELSDAVKVHRRKNFCIQQTLFRVDGIVRRLYVIKLLLSPLPGEIRDEMTQFRQIVDAVYSYLSNAMQTSDEPNSPSLDARIANLEHSCIMGYIRIARQETRLEAVPRSALLRKIPESSELIEKCIAEQTEEVQRWESCLADATSKGQEFVIAVATQRRDERAAILKTMEQCREVLTITTTVLADQTSA